LQRIRSSFYLVDPHASESTGSDDRLYGQLLLTAREELLLNGGSPATRTIVTLAAVMSRKAEQDRDPFLLFDAHALLRQQLNQRKDARPAELRLLTEALSDVCARYPAMLAPLGIAGEPPGDVLEAEFLGAEAALVVMQTELAAGEPSVDLGHRALTGYLVAARRTPDLLPALFGTSRDTLLDQVHVALAKRIALVAGAFADILALRGERAQAHEAAALAETADHLGSLEDVDDTADPPSTPHPIERVLELGHQGRHEDALAVLNEIAPDLLHHAVVSPAAVHVLQLAATTVLSTDPVRAAQLSIGAAIVADGLRLYEPAGDDRVDFGDAITTAYTYAVEVNLIADRKVEALCMADRARGRTAMESLAGGDKTVSRRAMPSGPPARDPTKQPVEQLLSAAHAEVSRLYNETGTPIPLSPLRLMTLGLHGGNFLLPVPLTGELAMFVLGGADVVAVRRLPVDLAALHHIAAELRTAMRIHVTTRGAPGTEPAEDERLATMLCDLYDILIAPVHDLFNPDRELTIVPYRELGLVPWALLTGPDGRYLVDDFALSVVPSLSTWDGLFNRGWGRLVRAYVAADPVLEPRHRARGLGPLPAARNDAHRLSTLLAGDMVPAIRLGADATETSYRTEARNATLVHLACHGALREPVGRSCLYLAADTRFDGVLTAEEVADIPLDNAVVFLAACDTGQGRISSDGVLGLGQSFLKAGAQAVILSLCKVADAATSVLAGHFYERLLAPDTSWPVAQALRAAMIATRTELAAGRIVQEDGVVLPPDPALWGSFFVLGRGAAYVNRTDQDHGVRAWTSKRGWSKNRPRRA
jgi:CHAT domain-containing protein